jgi:hypothetical protein
MFDLDNIEIEINCPNCDFFNPIKLKDVRLRNVTICRGCKLNIQLDDYMNSYKIESRKIESELNEISKAIDEINNISINLKF